MFLIWLAATFWPLPIFSLYLVYGLSTKYVQFPLQLSVRFANLHMRDSEREIGRRDGEERGEGREVERKEGGRGDKCGSWWRGCNEEQGKLCGNNCPTLLYLPSFHPRGWSAFYVQETQMKQQQLHSFFVVIINLTKLLSQICFMAVTTESDWEKDLKMVQHSLPSLKKDPQIGKVASFSRIPPPDSLTRIVTAKRP